jgi:hypothetical protein
MFIRQAAVFSSLGPVRMGLTYGHLVGRVFYLASQSGSLRLVKAQLFKGGFVSGKRYCLETKCTIVYTPVFTISCKSQPQLELFNSTKVYLGLLETP